LTTASLFLFQTPVPNYEDVDLSFCYEGLKDKFDFAKMDQTSGLHATGYSFNVQACQRTVEFPADSRFY
jgi:hypothetical protein